MNIATWIEGLERRQLLAASSGVPDGIGAMGDSYSDEYRIYPGARSTAANWVEQLAEDSNVSFGDFSSADPVGPGNPGYQFNWAADGATTADLAQQAAGLAAQAASGDVDLAVVFIGGNDFRSVYNVLLTRGPDEALQALAAVVPAAVANINAAVGTLLSPEVRAANPDLNLVLTTIPKLSHLPAIRGLALQRPELRPFIAAVDDARQVVNEQMIAIAAGSDRIAVADFATLIDRLFARKKVKVLNVEVERDDLSNPTNDPRHFMLGDGLHPGTIVQGLLANLIVTTANHSFGTHIDRLSKHDILQNAGLWAGRPAPRIPTAQPPVFSTDPGVTAGDPADDRERM